jgi:hypothetical protein
VVGDVMGAKRAGENRLCTREMCYCNRLCIRYVISKLFLQIFLLSPVLCMADDDNNMTIVG